MFLADPLFHRLWHTAAWTMVHFLWVGGVLALAAGGVRAAFKENWATINYAVTLSFFGLLAVAPMFIGAKVHSRLSIEPLPDPRAIVQSDERNVESASRSDFVSLERRANRKKAKQSTIQQNSSRDSTDNVKGWRRYVLALPWIWLIGTPITFVLLAIGFAGAQRLRNQSEIAPAWVREIGNGATVRLKISRSVTIAVCRRLTTPVLVGVVRPMILLPPAALSGWTTCEVEMALLHELAHVRRWDNLVNLFQRVIESVLFFHPAVWLVSAWVRFERERSCDRLVVQVTGRSGDYAQFLATIANVSLYSPSTSTSSSMAHGRLASRIRSILRKEQPMQVSRSILALVFTCFVVLSAAWGWRHSMVLAQDPSPHSKAVEASTHDQQRPKQEAKEKGAPSASRVTKVLVNNCVLSPMKKVILSSAQQGVLRRILVQEGDSVNTQQDLIAFQNDHLKRFVLEVEAQKSLANIAELRLARATGVRERNSGAVTRIEIKELEAQLQHAKTMVAKAQTEYETAAVASRIVSSMDGVVTRIHKRSGEAVRIGEPVVEVTNLNTFRVEGYVPADYLWTIKRGDRVEVKIHVHAQYRSGERDRFRVEKETFTGEIKYVSTKLEAHGKFRIWAEVANPKTLLREGLSGEMTVFSSDSEP